MVASVDRNDLRDAWRYLDARRRPGYASGGVPGHANAYERLVAFGGGTRAPPVHWVLSHPILAGEVKHYVREAVPGRAIDAAATRFWEEKAPGLEDDMQVCPATVARLHAARADFQSRLERRPLRAKD